MKNVSIMDIRSKGVCSINASIKEDSMIKKGHRVMVVLPEDARKANPMLTKYNGQEMKVVKKVLHGTRYYYELEGAESEYGIPYAFCTEWLISCGLR